MDQPPPAIELLTIETYRAIVGDLEPFWWDGRTPMVHPMFVHEFGNLSIVARDGEAVTGFLFGLRPSVDPGEAYVHLIGVHAAHRRRGIAAALYADFRARAKALGATKIRAMVRPGNAPSIAFHTALGMTPEAVPDYVGHGEDRLIFRAPID